MLNFCSMPNDLRLLLAGFQKAPAVLECCGRKFCPGYERLLASAVLKPMCYAQKVAHLGMPHGYFHELLLAPFRMCHLLVYSGLQTSFVAGHHHDSFMVEIKGHFPSTTHTHTHQLIFLQVEHPVNLVKTAAFFRIKEPYRNHENYDTPVLPIKTVFFFSQKNTHSKNH